MLLAGGLLGLAAAELPWLAAGDFAAPALPKPAFASRAEVRVIDGDTFVWRGERIRIADIDTPETHPPRCAREAALGARATARLEGLLEGPFRLARIDRDTDRYGRKLRIVILADGRSVGDVLIAEGLARRYAGGRRPWCV